MSDIFKNEQMENVPRIASLVNTGNSCYLNAILSSMYGLSILKVYFEQNRERMYTVLIKRFVAIAKESSDDLREFHGLPQSIISKARCATNHDVFNKREISAILSKTISYQLIYLLESMWNSESLCIPSSFRRVFDTLRNSHFKGFEQNDASDAMVTIFEQIQRELVYCPRYSIVPPNKSVEFFIGLMTDLEKNINSENDPAVRESLIAEYNDMKESMPDEAETVKIFLKIARFVESEHAFILEMFTGFSSSTTICPGCGYANRTVVNFSQLTIPVPNRECGTLNDCFDSFYGKEQLSDGNKIECSGCKQRVAATIERTIFHNPAILIVQLEGNHGIEFPLIDFDIKKYIDRLNIRSCAYTYTLNSVVYHSGDDNAGHYYTKNARLESGEWYLHNDETITRENTTDIINGNARVLIYIRDDMLADASN